MLNDIYKKNNTIINFYVNKYTSVLKDMKQVTQNIDSVLLVNTRCLSLLTGQRASESLVSRTVENT